MHVVTVDVVEFTFVAFDDSGVDILSGTLDDTFDVLLLGKTVVFIDDKVIGATEMVVTSICTVTVSVELSDVAFTVLEIFVIFRFADATFNGTMVNIRGSNVVDETGAAVVEASDVMFSTKPVRTAVVAFTFVTFVSIVTFNTEDTKELIDTVLLVVVVFVTQTVVLFTLISFLLPSVNVETISQGTFSTSVLSFSLTFKKQVALSLGALSGL